MSALPAHIVVVDSNRLFRAGLISILGATLGQSVDEAEDLEDLAQLAAEGTRFDLVLLEAGMIEEGGACPIAEVRRILPGARVTMLADKFDPAQLRKCLVAGAHGYLLKNISSETLQASLQLVLLGEKILPTPLVELLCQDRMNEAPAMAAMPTANGHAGGDLSEREFEILRCLVAGDSNKRIAIRLRIAEATVKVHLKSILRKTNAANRTQAAIWALQRGVPGVAAAELSSGPPTARIWYRRRMHRDRELDALGGAPQEGPGC